MMSQNELIMQRNMYARQLKDKTEMLKFTCDRLLEQLESDKLSHINELGEVQTLGSDVDVLCAKVSLLTRVCTENEQHNTHKDRMKELWQKEFLSGHGK